MKLALHWQVLLAILLAGIIGSTLSADSTLLGVNLVSVFTFFGDMFLNALKMLTVPLILASIISGISGLTANDSLARLGIKTLSLYMISGLIAILVGLFCVNLLTPGLIDGQAAGPALNLVLNNDNSAQLQQIQNNHAASGISDIFLKMFPPNIIQAAANGQMLGLIVFAVMFGLFMLKIEPQAQTTLRNFWQGIAAVMIEMTMFIMKFSPIGVFALVAKTVAITGFAGMQPLAVFFFTVLLALAIHTFIVLALALKYVGKVNPIKHYKAMMPVMLTAFSTASSSATLPITMEMVEEKSGVSNKIASFVLPLGATVNMNGSALYECVAAIFIAQAYGLDLSLAQQFLIVVIALLTSIGVAGIPAASLVAIAVILTAVGLPLEGIGLLLVTDRILDMLRTAVNVFSDTCCAVIVARSEGEQTHLL